MYPFWDTVIAPLITATDARRIVEVGALRGENTTLLLESLGPDAELHVIDPAPEFDPAEHERRFGGRYVFHRDISLNVLDRIGAFDVALVDGDHNWYTVVNELRVLRETSRKADAPLPVVVLHDVCWPYGRRDLYYAPEQIPEQYRQPYQRRGFRPGRSALLPSGGMNVTLDNAEREGGPRNGVMTALDDFLAEHDQPVRRLVLPIYFGLAIVVEEARLAATPALRAFLDRLETASGKDELLELSERIRLEAALWEQNVLRFREDQFERSARRYLALLSSALLDEHYLENEIRLEYVLGCAEKGREVNRDVLRDPGRFLRNETRRRQQELLTGAAHDGDRGYFPYASMGRARLEHFERTLERVRRERVTGDVAVCGSGRGGAAIFARGFLEAYELSDRRVWVADTFRAAAETTVERPLTDGGVADLRADLNQVRDAFARFGLLDERVRFLQGTYGDTLPDAPVEQLSVLVLGADVGRDAGRALDHLYDRISVGGFMIIEDAAEPSAAAAISEFRDRRQIREPLERVGICGATWRKERATEVRATSPESGSTRDRAPLAPPAPPDPVDLTVVVVFYNMRREAARTLQSLTRTYQQGVDALGYEVIVMENGSAPDQVLGEDFVRSFGPEFRYVDLGVEATPSPTVALNRGIALGRGKAFALMIDGAHVLTPGVLRHAMIGLESYAPAVVATQQWYVGPGQQPETVTHGYDTDSEDALFSQIAWPNDGYRLFEIGHFIGDRDWFDGMLESNCLFVPRSLLEQVGGFDDLFSMPGGGYANLELYERLGSSPGVTLTTILGEGSFHQVHGGTTTNNAVRDDRRGDVVSYAEVYRERRGRTLRGPVKPIHYVGALTAQGSWRTRSRRLSAESFRRAPVSTGPDGLPAVRTVIPDELKTAFIEAFWNSLAWQDTTWLGHPVPGAPTDLVAYQELIVAVRPDWIVETGTGAGGRALFLATVCDLVDRGHVVSVGPSAGPDLPHHPRITYVREKAHTEEAAEQVRRITGDAPHALVVLGSGAAVGATTQEFERYAPLVSSGSYVIVEGTIRNGRPVWPGFGPGPYEAVRRILATNPDFVQDVAVEKYGLTFNPGGFLRRLSS